MILGENISKVYNNSKDIQKVYSYGKLVWEKQNSEDIDYTTTPFTITAVDNPATVRFLCNDGFTIKTKKNNGTWEEKTIYSDYGFNQMRLDIGDVLYISAYSPKYEFRGIEIDLAFGQVDVSGNIFSLCYGDDFVGKTELPRHFSQFFERCNIRNANNLILPATTLIDGCYGYMFRGCTNLITAPSLPATTLASKCYQYMFSGCSNLTQTPELPATILANSCYKGMFEGCTNLVKIYEYKITHTPEIWHYESILPATTLAESCYEDMFYGCINLVSTLTLPAITLKSHCYDGMFYGCTSLTTAPHLIARTLSPSCYRDMFYGCTNLTYLTCGAKTFADDALTNWMGEIDTYGVFKCYYDSYEELQPTIPKKWSVEFI